MDKLKDFLIDRARERSTWLGLVSLLAALGVSLSPEEAEAVVAAAVAVGGAIAVFTKD